MKERLVPSACLPVDADDALLVGRLHVPALEGPSIVRVTREDVHDLSAIAPTMRDLLELEDAGRGGARGAARAAHRRALAEVARQLRCDRRATRAALAPRALRPAGDQGRGVTFVVEHARARDRGAGARRPGARPRRCAPRSSASSATTCRRVRAGLAGGRAAEGRADRAGRVVAVPRGRHRPRRRDLHQGAADVGGRHRRRRRHPSEVGVEQPRARGRARRRQPRPRRSARRSATTSTCATSRAAARCCSARRRTTTRPARSARSSGCSTSDFGIDDVRRCRRRAARRRARRLHAATARARCADQPRPARPRRRRRSARITSIPDGFDAVPRHDVRADPGPRRAGPGLHARGRRHRDARRRRRSARWSTASSTADQIAPWTFGAARADAQPREARAPLMGGSSPRKRGVIPAKAGTQGRCRRA